MYQIRLTEALWQQESHIIVFESSVQDSDTWTLLKAVQQESTQTLTMMQWLDRYYTIVGSHIGQWIQRYAYAYQIGHRVQLQSTRVLFWYA